MTRCPCPRSAWAPLPYCAGWRFCADCGATFHVDPWLAEIEGIRELVTRVGDDPDAGALWFGKATKTVGGPAPRRFFHFAEGPEVYYLVQQLRDVYTPEGVEIWLHSPNREFGGERPIDLLRGGEYPRVLAAVDRLRG